MTRITTTRYYNNLLSRNFLRGSLSFSFSFLFFPFFIFTALHDSKGRGDADTNDNRGSLFPFAKTLAGCLGCLLRRSRDVLSFIDAF